MNEVFSQLLVGILAVFMSVYGLWNDSVAVVDDAAALANVGVSGTEQSTTTPPFGYVSLLNILGEALTKMKDRAVNSTSTVETPEAETLTSAPSKLGDAIVNIYCTQETEEYRFTTSGTGFFISDQGVILTNAHVGQFLLLEKTDEPGEIECFVRSGLQAEVAYEVSLLYLSPTWLLENSDIINSTRPIGTGENDFALLYVTSSLNDQLLPESFTYLPPATSPLTRDYQGQPVVLVGYPSEEKITGERVVATTTITDLYTFDSGYADIFSVSASPLGHRGVSGSPVIDSLGRAIGVVTTKDKNTTILNAITLSHIDRQIRHETGYDLISIVKSDLPRRAELFNATLVPILQGILTNKLE